MRERALQVIRGAVDVCVLQSRPFGARVNPECLYFILCSGSKSDQAALEKARGRRKFVTSDPHLIWVPF